MVYRFYAQHGELPRVKIWTKTGEKELPRTVSLEYNPKTKELYAVVKCAAVVQVPCGFPGSQLQSDIIEQEYPICVREKYNTLLTLEEFKQNQKEYKEQIVQNIRNNYSAIWAGSRSIWEWD